jgi:phosphoribosylformylglycinamidine (FGAM) synthase-like enzyme
MRVVVVREYTDKYTGEGHVIGEKLDMTEERFAEIQDKGMFVVDISDEVVQQETPAVSTEQVEDQEQKTASEQAEPVERETSAPKQDKPAKGGRRNRSKKESEDK